MKIVKVIILLIFPLVSTSVKCQSVLKPLNFGVEFPENLTNLFESTFLDNTYLIDEGKTFNGKLLAIDLNEDSKTDYIYHNWFGGEGNETYLFLNREMSFEKFHFSGHVVNVDSTENTFTIYNEGCCDAFWNTIERYSITKLECKLIKSFLFDKNSIEKESFNNDIEVLFKAKEVEIAKEIETVIEIYHLRYSPNIDNEILEYPLLTRIGNIIATYPKGSRGKVLSTEIDSTGRVWYFVIMENNLRPTYSLFPERFLSDKFIGWISSQYVIEK